MSLVLGGSGRRLGSGGASQRASARTWWRSGVVPPTQPSPASGSSKRELAYVRCAATAKNPAQRATQAACAAGLSAAGTPSARCRAKRRRKRAASAPKRPPTSSGSAERALARGTFAVAYGALRRRGWRMLRRGACASRRLPHRERLLLNPRADARALLRSHAGEWLRAIPAHAASMLAPPEIFLALRRRLRLPLPCGHRSRTAPETRGTLSSSGPETTIQRSVSELARPGPHKLVVLASEVGGRWGSEAHDLVRRLIRAERCGGQCASHVSRPTWLEPPPGSRS